MNVNILEYQVLHDELKSLKKQVAELEYHLSSVSPESDIDIELHKCPFCKSDVKISYINTGYAVFCINPECYLYGGFGHRIYPSIIKAFDEWNNAFSVEEYKSIDPYICTKCGSNAKTISEPAGGVMYHKTACSNEKCEFAKGPNFLLYKSKNDSIRVWNEFVCK